MQLNIPLSPTGSAGSATATYTTPLIRGFIQLIKVDYTTQAATTDVTIAEVSKPNRTIVSLTDNNTDATIIPNVELTSNAGSGLTVYAPFYVESALTIAVAQADVVADSIVITILVSNDKA